MSDEITSHETAEPAVRQFATLSHLEPDLYDLFEVFPGKEGEEGLIDGKAYVIIDTNLTAEQAAIFINANGELHE